uniref:Uncharacterized protein n=1 Tax=Glossina austeni TaxID=7395 RepID=A0A1A9UYW0_GLOAU
MISSDDDDYDGANAFVDDSDDPTVWYSSQRPDFMPSCLCSGTHARRLHACNGGGWLVYSYQANKIRAQIYMFVIVNTECFHDDDDNDDNGVDNTSGKVSLFAVAVAVDFQLNFVLFNFGKRFNNRIKLIIIGLFFRLTLVYAWIVVFSPNVMLPGCLVGWLADSLADCPAHVGEDETRIVHRKQNE